MKKLILHTNNLTLGYSQKAKESIVAENVIVSLKKGKLIGLVGENGIGKSTLIRTISGIQKPLSGNVLLNNKRLEEYSALSLAQEISLVLTEKLPSSNLTVYELIALGRQPYTNWIGKLSETDKSKIKEAIEITQIQHLVDKKHSEISDGQLQKVLIARALAQDTPLIILDEPTTHLDLVHKVSLFKLLKKLTQESNKCILFSTHDIDLAIQLSDEIIVMLDGKVIQDEPCNLITKGIFSELFKNENIEFDVTIGKFIVK